LTDRRRQHNRNARTSSAIDPHLANGDPIAKPAADAITHGGLADGVYISPIPAWEIGLLSRPGHPNTAHFLPDPKTWFARVLAPRVKQAAFAPDIAIDSAHLPLPLHGDPAARLMSATAAFGHADRDARSSNRRVRGSRAYSNHRLLTREAALVLRNR
jgi:PIN domain nuclease of toxin-antitoxin system